MAAAGSAPDAIGTEAYELMERLFPLCRSLTGSGVRATFDVLDEYVTPVRTEIPSGAQVFDWTVPDEWNIRDAYIATPDGQRVVDFRRSSLHVVSYSEPVHARMSLEALRERLHTLPDQPDLVPYRTSYYHRTWGFCLTHRQLLELQPGEYDVVIDSTLEPGHLTYAEVRLEGESEEEVLISTYVCHPSLANDNLSGIAVATMLAKQLAQRRLRHSYRILFAPGTIGPLAWLHQNQDTLHRVKHGLAVSCVGDAGGFTYKRSRRGDREVDRAVELVLRDCGSPYRVVDWEPWGGDERQFCSPGFDLPVGCLMRTPHGGFAGYHTSADGLDRIRPESLGEAVRVGLDAIEVLETNGTFTNLSPYGEPQLGRRGLYRSSGGAVESPDDERALLWVLNLSDGGASLLDVAARSGLPYPVILRAAKRLEQADLLAPAASASRNPATRDLARR
jgi:aminopeptidase-like protein